MDRDAAVLRGAEVALQLPCCKPPPSENVPGMVIPGPVTVTVRMPAGNVMKPGIEAVTVVNLHRSDRTRSRRPRRSAC